MNWYGNVSPRQRRIYNTLIGIIALTLPCYCLGLLALTLAPSNRVGESPPASSPAPLTPTVIAIVTLPPDTTPSPTPTEWQPHTITPTPTASATPTGTPTPTASATNTATATPMASATVSTTATPTLTPSTATIPPTAIPTATVTPIPPATATPQGGTYTLRLVKREGDSLYVINDSRKAFPVEPLQLGEGSDALKGEEWNVENLKLGECVTVWKSGGRPQPPAVRCKQVGKRLERSGSHRFWLAPFNVYYQDKLIGTCADTTCTITINPS